MNYYLDALKKHLDAEKNKKHELAAMRARMSDQFYAISEPITVGLTNSHGEVIALVTRGEKPILYVEKP